MATRTLRTFWAVRPPDPVIDVIADLVRDLKAPCEKLGLKVAWVPAESMHFTLKFLGNVAEDAIAKMVARVESGLAERKLAAPRLFARGLAAFPNAARPRVLFVAAHGEIGEAELSRLVELQASLEGWLEELEYSREERAFQPHLTIGRVRECRAPLGKELMQVFTRHGERRHGDSFSVEELILYESRLGSDGARYTPLHRLPLCGN